MTTKLHHMTRERIRSDKRLIDIQCISVTFHEVYIENRYFFDHTKKFESQLLEKRLNERLFEVS